LSYSPYRRPRNRGTVPFAYITDPSDLPAVVGAVGSATLIGLDTETTGLNPRTDRVRLLQLAIDGSPTVYIIDLFSIDTAALVPLFSALAGKPLVMHNADFDLGFLTRLGFVPGVIHDTLILSKLVYGTRQPKGFHGLKEAVARELGRSIDKEEQASDWSAPELTGEQLVYAANDAAVLLPLYEALLGKIESAGLERVADIERRAVPAVAWLAGSGVDIDRAAWEALAREGEAEAERLSAALDAVAPLRPGDDPKWNWNSWQQVVEAFKLRGIDLPGTADAVLAAVKHPMAAALRELRAARKLVSVYGQKWLRNVADDGRVYADWSQLGSDAGRMSCAGPNLQQLPRDKRYRKCFVAPPGRVLVKADYSQIELRIAAKVSGNEALLGVYQRGEDIHVLTAQRVLGGEEVTPEQRQLAKAVNFGLLYGMGVNGFRSYAKSNYGVELKEAEAGRYREAFFEAYPGLGAWHYRTGCENWSHHTGRGGPAETRTLAGRRRLFARESVQKKIHGQVRERLNSPVQGTGADGLKLALALLWERRDQCPGAFPVLVVHDEIVVECDQAQAVTVADWLKAAMMDAMSPLIEPVPVEVDVKVGRSWGETLPLAEWRATMTPDIGAASPIETPDISSVNPTEAPAGSDVRLILGDSLEVLRTWEPGSVDAVITDPPYSSGGLYRADRANFTTDEKYTVSQHQGKRPNFSGDNMDQRSWINWCREWLGLALHATRTGGHLLVFTDWRQLPALTDAIQHAGWVWRGALVWDKTEAAKAPHTGYFGYQAEFICWATRGPVPRRPTLAQGGDGRMPGVFRKAVSAAGKFHQTGKPVEVMRWLVRCVPPGGTVLDPFMGSGTTGVAAAQAGLSFVGIEKSPEYFAVAERRLAEARKGAVA
jgi:DNA polymerase-1